DQPAVAAKHHHSEQPHSLPVAPLAQHPTPDYKPPAPTETFPRTTQSRNDSGAEASEPTSPYHRRHKRKTARSFAQSIEQSSHSAFRALASSRRRFRSCSQ